MLLKIKATSHTSIPDHGPQLQTMSYTRPPARTRLHLDYGRGRMVNTNCRACMFGGAFWNGHS